MKSLGELILIEGLVKLCILSILILVVYFSYTIIKVKFNKKIEYKKSLLKKQAIIEINKNRLKEEHKKMFLCIKEF